uniref:Uncharacterized protein n=1 Tax=Clandestinovirus TaxID=2831644 RepID=A0A8F8KLL9_9VIRU|nr:hypothetical protein KOM_12_376 [Clandestinovirus]
MFTSGLGQPFYIKKAGKTTWYSAFYRRISKATAMKTMQKMMQNGVKLVANAVAAKRALKVKKPIKKAALKRRPLTLKGGSRQKRKVTKTRPIKVSGALSLSQFSKMISQKSDDSLCLGGGSKLHIPKHFASVLNKKVNVGKGPIYFVFYDSAEYITGKMPKIPKGNATVKLVKSVGQNGNRHIVYKLTKQNPTFKQLVEGLHLTLHNFFECLFDVRITATTSATKKAISANLKGKFLAVKGNR